MLRQKQIELLTDLQKRDLIPKTEVSSAIARILENEGLVKIIKKPKYRINAEKNEHNVTLTEEQQEVAKMQKQHKIRVYSKNQI